MPKKNIIWVVAILAATVVALWVTRSRPSSVCVDGRRRSDPFDEAVAKIKDAYYVKIEDDEPLMRGAIGGLVGRLDEFSSYFPPSRQSAFRRRMDGLAEGLGLRVAPANGRVEVTAVAANSPARAAGIRPGMQVLTIDGVGAAGLKPRELRKMLHPPPGRSVELTLRAPRRKARTVKVAITAGQYHVRSVSGLYRSPSGRWRWMLDGDARVAYVRIAEFVNDTAGRVLEALRRAGPIDGLVLDVRGNPGGKSEVAVQVADLFLREGLIVKMLGRSGVEATYEAHSSGTLPPMAMVVLVDGATASGAELLAGALWAQNRAVLVGTRTRGKGCVQSMIDLGDMGLVNITTAQFVFSRGGPITRRRGAETWGLQPHVRVSVARGRVDELNRLRILAEYGRDEPSATRPAVATQETVLNRLLRADAQLLEGLELIRRHRVKPILARAKRAARRAALRQANTDEATDSD